MKPANYSLFISLLSLLLLTSCVSQKKYQAALSREQSLISQNTQLNDEVVRLRGQVANLQ